MIVPYRAAGAMRKMAPAEIGGPLAAGFAPAVGFSQRRKDDPTEQHHEVGNSDSD
jgi:hypothetical protein